MVVVILVLASAGETAATGGVADVCGMVGLAAGTVLGLVFDEVAFTVVAVVGVDVGVGFGEDVVGLVAIAETSWVSAEVEDTAAGAEDTVA